ncbi:hypothetical protein A9Q84_21300 [Halobacteriovorax marinus]|uniref:Uncharacterized protein n=1 Tax=Halobacteriovorax marinus TaxID=97084 RepID=A0A1Y5F825_9BACT|nr:hypothetical protein A9Q84_21300 [Halobacteriovorax marinus]
MKVFLVLLTLVFSVNLFGREIPEVNEFDIRYYHPENYGLKDLVFEIRISNLVETLNKRQNFGRIEDLYFKIYWMFPGQYQIKVFGFPKGFLEVKHQLKQMIKNRLDFVIPLKLAPRVRSYELSYFKTKGAKGVRGKDRTGSRPVSEIQLKFKRNGMLKEFKTFSPTGVNTSHFDLTSKGWSNNKWVVDKMIIKLIQGVQLTTIENDFTYKPISGFGFPQRVDIKTSQEILTNNNGKSNKRTVSSSIEFSNYEVNTGKAQRYMIRGIKK